MFIWGLETKDTLVCVLKKMEVLPNVIFAKEKSYKSVTEWSTGTLCMRDACRV